MDLRSVIRPRASHPELFESEHWVASSNGHGPGVDKPLRAPVLSREGLVARAGMLAKEHSVQINRWRSRSIRRRFEDNAQLLERLYQALAAAARDGDPITPGGEWFLDNFHVIEQHEREIREFMPSGYYRSLPLLTSGPLLHYARVYALALEVVAHTDGVIEWGLLSSFLSAYQSTQVLSIGELWAMPIMLRVALMESLRRLGAIALETKHAEQRAEQLSEFVLADDERASTEVLLELAARLKQEGDFNPAIAVHLLRKLRSLGTRTALALQWLEQWLSEKGYSSEELLRQEQIDQAANRISIGNAVTSLKSIANLDWLTWMESQSKVDVVLRADPAGYFSRSDFKTRNRYRDAIEKLSRQAGRDEVSVAKAVVELASAGYDPAKYKLQTATAGSPLKLSHIGFFLLDEGRAELERQLGVRQGVAQQLLRWARRNVTMLYLSGIGFLFALLVALTFSYQVAAGAATWQQVLVLLILFLPLLDLAINGVHWLCTHLVAPRPLPKLDLRDGIPDELRTVVAVHAVLRDVGTIEKAFSALEVRFLANQSPNLRFVLLADLADSAQESNPDDRQLLSAAQVCLDNLNQRYCANRIQPFAFLCRRRLWNESERCFLGWERKRGKVEEFNRFILGSGQTTFNVLLGDTDFIKSARFVITLDADTTLPRGSAQRLIETAAHPLNEPCFDGQQNIVKQGYSIIQPRIGVVLTSGQFSHFSRIFSGHSGLDPYTSVVSDVYQDLFGEGNFVGKGIYCVAAFERALSGRVPENALLSHDLFEGLFARVGLASDIELLDDFPTRYNVYARRQHRWVRGDWQLLPWLGRWVRGRDGKRYRSPISAIGYWKLLDNLRRSLMPPALLGALLLSWLLLPGSYLFWALLVFLIVAFPVYAQVANSFMVQPLGLSLGIYVRSVTQETFKNSAQALLTISFLPSQAYLMLHAVTQTLYRLVVSKRRMLDWETAYQSERRLGSGLASFMQQMAPGLVLSVAFLSLLVMIRPSALAVASPLLFLWLLAPFLAFAVSQPRRERVHRVSTVEREKLTQIARQTWNYFADLMNAENNYLIPDNIQLFPKRVVAHRTSPTNIGLSFLSVLSAYDLGFIELPEVVERLERCMQSLLKLERFHGHFLNWYDTRELRTLYPRYVSTVDNGNLIGHLIALRVGLEEIIGRNADAQYPELRTKLIQLIEQCELIFKETDFRLLYDTNRKLFSIGYRVDDMRLDGSYYDLLASEARLASFIAIAKGEVPQEHWFCLGRQLTESYGGKALLSWSATMFEYLMPILVMKDFPETILHETYRSVVRSQVAYGRLKRVPWGISESGYCGIDFEHTYQYKAFGIPGLGLKRGLSDDLVISPYSTFLAMMVDFEPSYNNLPELDKCDLRGEYGYYEAVDYTRERLGKGESSHVIKSFLAHHQGMTLVALNNILNNGIMQLRFHSDAKMRATELLLHERFPRKVPLLTPHQAELSALEREEESGLAAPEVITTPHTEVPRTRVLSNGTYSVMVTSAGGGYSFADGGVALTRWREDAASDAHGTFVFVRDLDDGTVWSASYQPTRVEPQSYEVILNPDKVEFKRRDNEIALHTEITVSPEDNVELRRITVTNLSGRLRNLEFTSYGEVVIGSAAADLAHPVFAKMFVESEFVQDLDALIFARRPRSRREKGLFLLHMLSMPICWDRTYFETSRFHFLGRGQHVNDPRAMHRNAKLSGSVGAVLDPIFALRTRVEIEPGGSQVLSFVTAYSDSRDQLVGLAKRYHDAHLVTRAFELAWSKSNVELRLEQITVAQSHTFARLGNALWYAVSALRSESHIISQNRLPQSGLWRFAISGDLPIVLVRVSEQAHLKLVHELLLAHSYLRARRVQFDLVILNEYLDGYMQNLQGELEQMVRVGHSAGLIDKPGGIFLRSMKQISPEERVLLLAVARVTLSGEKGSLAEQLAVFDELRVGSPERKGLFDYLFPEQNSLVQLAPRSLHLPSGIEFFNGRGGFISAGRAYWLNVSKDRPTPLPWVNVIANQHFGFVISESGAGYTWAENSRENRITSWQNDPVTDLPSEVLYLRDAQSGDYWSATPQPCPGHAGYDVEHHFGYSSFSTEHSEVRSQLVVSGALNDKVKWYRLRVQNNGKNARRIELYFYVEWCLAVSRNQSAPHIVTAFDNRTKIITAANYFSLDFPGRIGFVGATPDVVSYTADRQEFIGRNRSVLDPQLLAEGVSSRLASLTGLSGFSKLVELSKTVGAGLDSCAVLKVVLDIEPGQTREACFFLGQASNPDEARAQSVKFKPLAAQEVELSAVSKHWSDLTDTLQVSTPSRSFDIMVNGWLVYQTLACRILGRSALYQSGGAFGFRDQLQDAANLVMLSPELARNQILLHASRQFVEGDVQHWWHPPMGRGIRTRISDNYLWLPYCTARYIETVGDDSILQEEVPFLEGPLLEREQMEHYFQPAVSQQRESLYHHCVLALEQGFKFGPHGLPLIGSGDWNDGMNEVGPEGKGESIWLGWFLAHNLKEWSAIAARRNDNYRAQQFENTAQKILSAIEESSWDGSWYRRAYFDNGEPLGSSMNDECQIDSLSQSWAVITGGADKARARVGMESVYKRLVRKDDGIIALLDPPFDKGRLDPGYIKGYLPGVRENGGQYTHAACWVVIATAMLGDGDRALELFELINPIRRTSDGSGVDRYQGEPYATCGDVYSVPPHGGRAGWSWYTGSSGWLYRAGMEFIVGFKRRGDHVAIDPCVPKDWKEFKVTYRHSGSSYLITVRNPDGVCRGVKSVTVDGQQFADNRIPVRTNSGEHNVVVVMG